MQYTHLGRTGLQVSRLCLGTMNFGPRTSEQDSFAIMDKALDLGINFFDSANVYGGKRGEGITENIVGRWFAQGGGRRDKVVIATKVYGTMGDWPNESRLSARHIKLACEASLRRLQTDYIDLYQIHWPSRTIPLADSMEALMRLQEAGKIRAIGVSNFGTLDLDDLLAVGRAESNQLAYSMLSRAVEYEIQPKCVANEISILCYSPLMHGMLTGKFAGADDVPVERARTRHFSSERAMTVHSEAGCEAETFAAIDGIRQVCAKIGHPMAEVALAWLIRQPGVAAVVAGARRPDQIAELVRAVEIQLSDETLAELDRITAPVKQKLGRNADMWRTESRIR